MKKLFLTLLLSLFFVSSASAEITKINFDSAGNTYSTSSAFTIKAEDGSEAFFTFGKIITDGQFSSYGFTGEIVQPNNLGLAKKYEIQVEYQDTTQTYSQEWKFLFGSEDSDYFNRGMITTKSLKENLQWVSKLNDVKSLTIILYLKNGNKKSFTVTKDMLEEWHSIVDLKP